MAKKKTFNITSLATSESKDLNRLSEQARKGWLLQDVKIPYLSYELVETNGVDRDYLIDFNDNITEQYMNTLKKKGWNYVCSNESLHYFYAHKNTPPIFSNIQKKIELYHKKAKQFLITFLVLGVINIATILGLLYFNSLSSPNRQVAFILFSISLLLLVINAYFSYASFAYHSRANQLRKETHETTNS